MRGIQVGSEATKEQIENLLSLKINLIRFQIAPYQTEDESLWRKQVIEHSTKLVSLAKEFEGKIKFIVDLHRVPASLGKGAAIKGWTLILQHIKGLPAIHGYGILNEPKGSSGHIRTIMKETGEFLRKEDNKKLLILTFPFSDPPHFLSAQDYGFSNCWYEVHMYLPLAFTHQKLYQYIKERKYPDQDLSKERLKKLLLPVRNFQKQTKKPIYVGEFSVCNYADEASRAAYIGDCISIFEKWHWHWTYHAMFESEIWNPQGKVLDVLKEGWARNHHNWIRRLLNI